MSHAILLDEAITDCGQPFAEPIWDDVVCFSMTHPRRSSNPRDAMGVSSVVYILKLQLAVKELVQQNKALLHRVEKLEKAEKSVMVPITTLDPEPFELIRDLPVVVVREDDGYLATFFDAGIGMTGDSREEAVANLRLLLVDMFDDFETHEAQLGPEPERQLAVLRIFIRRQRSAGAMT